MTKDPRLRTSRRSKTFSNQTPNLNQTKIMNTAIVHTKGILKQEHLVT